jgi:hypothetical protein
MEQDRRGGSPPQSPLNRRAGPVPSERFVVVPGYAVVVLPQF